MARWLLAIAIAVSGFTGPASADLVGHGGPVRALAISADGATLVSGSFDHSAIVWALDRQAAEAVLRFHDSAVNAVATLPDGRLLTGGEDGRIALWKPGAPDPEKVFAAHAAPIAALAVSPHGARVGSASWDGTARITNLATGAVQRLQGHHGNVNAIAFTADGAAVTAGYDGTLRRWPPREGDAATVVTLGAPLNALALAPDGEAIVGGADGILRMVARDGSVRAALDLESGPLVSLARSGDGARIAAGTIGGAIMVVEHATASLSLRVPGSSRGPAWSLVFTSDARDILSGGNDGVVRRWNARSGEPVGASATTAPPPQALAAGTERGAQVFHACAACHTLTRGEESRAGPTLHGVFGRKIATAPGYRYSEALKALNIIWNPETISKLFEVGPARFTPGTKMPEQRIVAAADREALVRFLEKATATGE